MANKNHPKPTLVVNHTQRVQPAQNAAVEASVNASVDPLEQILGEAAQTPKTGRGRPSKLTKEQHIAAVKGQATAVKSSASSQTPVLDAPVNPTLTVLGNARVLNPDISIKLFQIYFKQEHKKVLDPQMEPFDNSRRKNHLLEFDVFRRLAASEHTQNADYWGAVSWKFPQSMGFGGGTFKSFIHKNPGYDIYFCHPHTAIEAVYENLWVQGEVSHPRFIELSRAFLEAAGLDPEITCTVIPSGFMTTANYFVANAKFWQAYLEFINTALQRAEAKLPQNIMAILLSPVADAKGLHNGANYVPFIVERLLTEFLLQNIGQFKAIKVQSPKLEGRLTEHHRSLRSMKDLAIRSKSELLLDAWRNYRNLLLSVTAEPKALEPYIKLLTNKNIRFGDYGNA